MLGKPRYKEGTTVKFIFRNELKTGIVFVVDKYGTFDNLVSVIEWLIKNRYINKEYLKQ